ncbi:mogroside IE synthase-like [Rosa sericea]
MEKEDKAYEAHCLVVSFPTQGHINPMLQFSKRLERKGLEVTLVTTQSFHKRLSSPSTSITLETISDGHDEGGSTEAESMEAYLDRFREVGSRTLTKLIEKLSESGHKVDCIVYDAFIPWPLEVAKRFGIVGVAFFTQSCAVDNIYYNVQQGLLKVPCTNESEILLPGVRVPLRASDMPSFVSVPSQYPAFLRMVVDQFSNVDKADWILCNTFYELEVEEADWMAKFWPLRTIGPTIPSMYLDKRHEDDKEYGFSLFKPNSDACMKWLKERQKGSVAYVSFGSLAELGAEQMEELGWGLKNSNIYFLWVVREKEANKLPRGFAEATSEKGLVVSWCPQLEVLATEAVGCFVTHCGWNSTLEALSLGVPMVAVPQWTDQSTNAKYIMDVWKMGLRAQADEKGIVRREEIEYCVREILERERGKEIQKNAWKWKELARKAVDKGGSSDRNIDEFIAKLVQHAHVAS